MIVEWTNGLLFGTLGLILVLLLASYFLYINKTNLIRRIFFLLIGLLGIWFLFAEPGYERVLPMKSQVIDSEEGIYDFLTGSESQKTDSLLLVGSDHDLEEMSLLKNYAIDYIENGLPKGFVDIEMPVVTEHENWILRGRVNLLNDEDRIELTLPNGEKREADKDEEGHFEIETKAPTRGLYEYFLRLTGPEVDTLQETLPVQVKAASKLEMLLLAESPSFEFNYFKNYWSGLGHGLLQRVKIAKDKYSTSYINMPEVEVGQVSEIFLDGFDLLLIDLGTWNEFSNSERRLIKKHVEEKALALILALNKPNEKPRDLPSIAVSKVTTEMLREVPLSLREFTYGSAWEVYKNNAIFSIGFGKVLVLGYADSYKLLLGDEARAYQQWWSDIISELYLEKVNGFEVQAKFMTYEGRKTEVKLFNLGRGSRIIFNDETKLSLLRTPLIEGFAKAEITPEYGWNKLWDDLGQKERWIYAFKEGEWSVMRASHASKVGRALAGVKKDAIEKSYTQVLYLPWYWGYILTVMGLGFLWMDEKVSA